MPMVLVPRFHKGWIDNLFVLRNAKGTWRPPNKSKETGCSEELDWKNKPLYFCKWKKVHASISNRGTQSHASEGLTSQLDRRHFTVFSFNLLVSRKVPSAKSDRTGTIKTNLVPLVGYTHAHTHNYCTRKMRSWTYFSNCMEKFPFRDASKNLCSSFHRSQENVSGFRDPPLGIVGSIDRECEIVVNNVWIHVFVVLPTF